MEDSGSDDDVFDVEDEDLSRGGVPAPVICNSHLNVFRAMVHVNM